MSQEMGRLVIQRTSPQDIKIRDLYVRLQGHPEETIQFGESLEYELPPGDYEVLTTNRLYTRRLTVAVAYAGTTTVVAGNVPGGCLAALFVFGAGAYRVLLEEATASNQP
jgi:hypothetical protein